MSDIISAMTARFSTRKFESTPLTPEEIEVFKEAALSAPTARDVQELRFSFVTNQELITKIAGRTLASRQGNVAGSYPADAASKIFYDAPTVILITGFDNPEGLPLEKQRSNRTPLDAGIAAQNLALAAESLDLGSCIIVCCEPAFYGPGSEEIRDALHMVDGESFWIALAVGQKATSKEPHTPKLDPFRFID